MPITDNFVPASGDAVEQHDVIDALLKEYDPKQHGTHRSWGVGGIRIGDIEAGRQMLDADKETQRKFVAALTVRLRALQKVLDERGLPSVAAEREPHAVLIEILGSLLRRKLPLTEDNLLALVEWLGSAKAFYEDWYPINALLKHLEDYREKHEVSPALAAAAGKLAKHIAESFNEYWARKFVSRFESLAANDIRLPLSPGEAWSDAVLADFDEMPPALKAAWMPLQAHCATANASNPSDIWLKKARERLEAVGFAEFKQRVLKWFPLVDKPRTEMIHPNHGYAAPDENLLIIEPHAIILRGLAWCCGLQEDRELARALTALALSTYRKIPLKGPREPKIGNACLTALSMMPGTDAVGEIALLKVRARSVSIQKIIEKALENAAERTGIPREELEEMSVPAYGLTEVGRCTETFGEFTAELTVAGENAKSLVWSKSGGKPQQSVPAQVKAKFAADLKEFQGQVKDIQRMLPAQSDRIDNLFREQRSWPCDKWRERYLDHPLVGIIARRLVWEFKRGNEISAAIHFEGRLTGVDGKPIADPGADTVVQLWHPIGRPVEEVTAWRYWLDAHQVQQPFKQAHREIYLLTDAERATGNYSNRFAAHILRQHQFNALCAARGWINRLRLSVDAEFPPATVLLPKWNLRAEFWADGMGDHPRDDLSESGAYVHVATDQVRFYAVEAPPRGGRATAGRLAGYFDRAAEPVPLDQIPPLVFSEVMRDVDLFVGVCSVGNDPTWQDGGPGGRHRDYWEKYAFGALGERARTRKEVLARLVPRLKIAGQCSFEEKFLIVKGSMRTYKIHLGSGNVLMEPGLQYLCIVPKEGVGDPAGIVLPFEGDRTLSIILSKAFLLADDAKIKDSSILNQIRS